MKQFLLLAKLSAWSSRNVFPHCYGEKRMIFGRNHQNNITYHMIIIFLFHFRKIRQSNSNSVSDTHASEHQLSKLTVVFVLILFSRRAKHDLAVQLWNIWTLSSSSSGGPPPELISLISRSKFSHHFIRKIKIFGRLRRSKIFQNDGFLKKK